MLSVLARPVAVEPVEPTVVALSKWVSVVVVPDQVSPHSEAAVLLSATMSRVAPISKLSTSVKVRK